MNVGRSNIEVSGQQQQQQQQVGSASGVVQLSDDLNNFAALHQNNNHPAARFLPKKERNMKLMMYSCVTESFQKNEQSIVNTIHEFKRYFNN